MCYWKGDGLDCFFIFKWWLVILERGWGHFKKAFWSLPLLQYLGVGNFLMWLTRKIATINLKLKISLVRIAIYKGRTWNDKLLNFFLNYETFLFQVFNIKMVMMMMMMMMMMKKIVDFSDDDMIILMLSSILCILFWKFAKF